MDGIDASVARRGPTVGSPYKLVPVRPSRLLGSGEPFRGLPPKEEDGEAEALVPLCKYASRVELRLDTEGAGCKGVFFSKPGASASMSGLRDKPGGADEVTPNVRNIGFAPARRVISPTDVHSVSRCVRFISRSGVKYPSLCHRCMSSAWKGPSNMVVSGTARKTVNMYPPCTFP